MRTFALLSALLTGTAFWAAPGDIQIIPTRIAALIHAKDSPSEIVYQTVEPKMESVKQVITATGALAATENIEVGSQLSGRIDQLLVDFNDQVKKGQPLAVLDTRSYQAHVDESRAALAGAKASVKIAEARVDRAKIDALQAETMRTVLAARVDNAKIQLASVNREVGRKTTLAQHGASTLADLQDATSRRELAESAIREAQANLAAQDVAIEGAHADLTRTQSELDAARTQVSKLAAELQSAEVDLDRCWIRSPIDGVVVGRSVNDGQTLATSLEARTLFNIAGDLHHMEVYARVDESDIGKIANGQQAEFTVDAFPGEVFPATVKQIRKAPQIVQNVVTYTVVLSAENPNGRLLPGMTALAKITISHTPHALTVPMAALQFKPTNQVAALAPLKDDQVPLWVLRGTPTPKMIPVVAGEQQGERVTIRSGDIRPGDRIIVGVGGQQERTASNTAWVKF